MRFLVILVAAFACVSGAAQAQEPEQRAPFINVVANAESDTGWITVGLITREDIGDITFGELVDGRVENPRPMPVRSFGDTPGYDGLAGGQMHRAFAWICDRTNRTFVATGTTAAGEEVEGSFLVRTPSCRNRLTVTIPQRVRAGRNVRVELLDRWGVGDVDAQVCRGLAANATRCTQLNILEGRATGSALFRPREDGYWTVTVRGPLQRTQRTVAVGVKPRAKDLAGLPQITATGDSLMQGLDGLLEDRLGSLANVSSQVLIGSGLSSDIVEDWDAIPVQQKRRFKPDATVLFLGANDSSEMDGVVCCGDEWQAIYQQRARKLMRAYTRGGSHLFYLTVPIARDPKRNLAGAAVNAAIAKAAQGVPRVQLLNVSDIFTPDGVYRERGVIDGEDIQIYQADGIHLSFAAARIVSDIIINSLEEQRIVE